MTEIVTSSPAMKTPMKPSAIDTLTLAYLSDLFAQVNFGDDKERRVINNKNTQYKPNEVNKSETEHIVQLIELFNKTFAHLNVILVRGKDEPEYFPASNSSLNPHTPNTPAKIVFAHGFFASALHELSHWCIAGKHRRTLLDFGYWYAPDGRDEAQQLAFEKVEIKPQAIECLFNLACGRTFRVSQDNLFADFDTSNSTFEQDVYWQVYDYLQAISTLPQDALTLIRVLKAVDW